MGATQRFLMAVLPAKLLAAVKAGTEEWLAECSACGHRRDLGQAGGVRFCASGRPRQMGGLRNRQRKEQRLRPQQRQHRQVQRQGQRHRQKPRPRRRQHREMGSKGMAQFCR